MALAECTFRTETLGLTEPCIVVFIVPLKGFGGMIEIQKLALRSIRLLQDAVYQGSGYRRVLLTSKGELSPPFIASLTCSSLAPHVSSMSRLATLDMGGPMRSSCFLSISLGVSGHAQFTEHGRVPRGGPLHAPVRAVADPALEPASIRSGQVSLVPLNYLICA